jgi:hypothetical protein
VNLDRNDRYIFRHLRFGWWSLLVFLSLGILFEVFHGFKIGFYTDTHNETRRTMWTLAHAHGTLIALVHMGFSLALRSLPSENMRLQRFASPLLMATSVLLPGGFFLGGLWIHGGDPGLGILLLPVGAGCFLVAVLMTALAVTRLRDDSGGGKK